MMIQHILDWVQGIWNLRVFVSREKYRVFIDLTYLSSYLVLRRFFRNLNMEAAPRIQAMRLGPYAEVPVVRQPNRRNRQARAAKYYDGLFFLFLFIMGALFSVLVHRIIY